MARARSVKDGKVARDSRHAPARQAAKDAGVPDPAQAAALTALAERVAVLETRMDVLEATATASAAPLPPPEAVVPAPPAHDVPDASMPAMVPDRADVQGSGDGQGSADAQGPADEQGPADDDEDHADDDGAPSPGRLRTRHGKPGGLWIVGAARLPKGAKAAWTCDVATADLLDRDWAAHADALAALAHPVRLAVVREVLRGSRSVSSLATLPGVGTSGQLYHHIKPLLAAGWLRQDGRGRYEVPEQRILRLLTVVAALDG